MIYQTGKQVRITKVTYCRWKREYDRLRSGQAQRVKVLERQLQVLISLAIDLSLGKTALNNITKGSICPPGDRMRWLRRCGVAEHQNVILVASSAE